MIALFINAAILILSAVTFHANYQDVVESQDAIVIFGEGSATALLVLDQVALSLQLPFAVIPLVMFTSDRRLMRDFVNPQWLKVLAWAIATIIVGLNAWLLWQTFLGWL